MSGSLVLGPIVTAAPADAACIIWLGQCNKPPPTTTPPPPAPVPPAPNPSPPPPPVPPVPTAHVSPDEAATMFFDATNAERAAVGLPALGWREDVATMATAHSVDMAQQGGIFHGSFVSDVTLRTLNAHEVGENVGMGDSVERIHAALMASEHHRDNILDSGFNQVGIGVVDSGGTYFVTEDFLQAKGGPVTARPKPVARPAARPAAVPRPVTRVAAKPKAVAPAAAPPVTAASPAAAPAGVVTAVPADFGAAPREATPLPVSAPRPQSGDAPTAWWVAVMGALALMATAGGHVRLRRRRAKA